jgi:hypothetical protein
MRTITEDETVTELPKERVFEVICVTTRSENDKIVHFHLPTDCLMTRVCNEVITEFGVTRTRSWATYYQTKYPIRYIRAGFDGQAVVIAIEISPIDKEIVELYTLTPIPGSSATREDLVEKFHYCTKNRC